VSRRPVPRRATAPALAVEQLEELDAPEVIPEGSFLVASLRWASSLVQGQAREHGAIGVYQVDHYLELVRPRCTCGWTTEGSALFRREAIDRMTLHDRCDCYGEVGQVAQTTCRCGAETLYRVLTGHAAQHGLVVELVKYPPGWAHR
jgi:hypothetical protein